MSSQAHPTPGRQAQVDQSELAVLVGLPVAWISWLVQNGQVPKPLATEPNLRWLSVDVDHWARRIATAREEGPALPAPIPTEDLRLVALRMLPLHELVIASRLGLTASLVRRRLRDSMFALLRTVESDVVTAWQETASADRAHVARRSRVSPTLVRLILDGFPAAHPGAISPARAATVQQMWRAGAPWHQIAERTAVTERAAARPESRVVLASKRWSPADAGRFLGWSSGRIYQRPPDLPQPDGADGDRVWWWSTTIQTWAATLDECPTCGGRFRSVGRHAHWHDHGR